MRLTASRGPQLPGDVGGGGEIDGGGTAEQQLLVEKPELVRIKTTYPKLGVPDSQRRAANVLLANGHQHLVEAALVARF
jgi:hypothetical protein